MHRSVAAGYDSEAALLTACRQKEIGAFETLYLDLK